MRRVVTCSLYIDQKIIKCNGVQKANKRDRCRGGTYDETYPDIECWYKKKGELSPREKPHDGVRAAYLYYLYIYAATTNS